jgi:type I restriction enzyme, R subunit
VPAGVVKPNPCGMKATASPARLRRSSSLSRTGPAAVTAISRRRLRDRIIQNAQDALDFLAEALRIARAIVNAEKHPDEAVVVLDDDHIGVLSRIIRDHAPPGLTITERNLAEGIDQVVTRTLARSWDNADARSRGVRRATPPSSAGTCSSR